MYIVIMANHMISLITNSTTDPWGDILMSKGVVVFVIMFSS